MLNTYRIKVCLWNHIWTVELQDFAYMPLYRQIISEPTYNQVFKLEYEEIPLYTGLSELRYTRSESHTINSDGTAWTLTTADYTLVFKSDVPADTVIAGIKKVFSV